MTTIIGISVENRQETSKAVQDVLTKYGCEIKTRLGINDYKESGLSVEGLRDSSAEYIRVIKEEFRRINLTKGYYHLNV